MKVKITGNAFIFNNEWKDKTNIPAFMLGGNEMILWKLFTPKIAPINVTKNIGTNLGKRLALLLAPGLKVHGITPNYYQLF